MLFEGHVYSVLIVSSSEKFSEAVRPLFCDGQYAPVTTVSSIAAAKRCVLERFYDLVILNSPLPDDMGTKFAIDLCSDKNTVCLMLLKPELHEAISARVLGHGVFTLQKPISSGTLSRALDWMKTIRERLRGLEKKTLSLGEKMEEIRIVNRAKWLLIENLKMTEPDAHRYIEKQAMDLCLNRREIAEMIIGTYQ